MRAAKPPGSAAMDRLRRAQLGAFFRPGQAVDAGVDYRALRRLVEAGEVQRVARGLYRLADAEPTEDYTLAAVCARVPAAVICLLTALRVHGIGTRVSREVWIGIPQRSRTPSVPRISLRVVRFSGAAIRYGVVAAAFEGVAGRITSPARTVLDCFRYERLVGREAAIEALQDAIRKRLVTVDSLYRAMEVLPSRRLLQVLEATAP